MKKSAQFKFVFGLVLLAALLAMADFNAVSNMAKQLKYRYALAGMLVFIITGMLDLLRLRLASPSAQKLSWRTLIHMHFESYAIAQFLPGNVGMDVYKVAMIGKRQQGYWEPALVLFALRVFSLLVMVILAITLLLYLPEWRSLYLSPLMKISTHPIWIWSTVASVLVLVFSLVVRFLQHRWTDIKHQFKSGINAYRLLTRTLIAKLVTISLLIIAIRIVTFLLTLAAFDQKISLSQAVLIALLGNISWLLPLSPAGIGIREGVITGLLSWINIVFETALLVALLNRSYFIMMGLIGSCLFIIAKRK